jgi:enoyl-CoA hydratase/carnithine racemase
MVEPGTEKRPLAWRSHSSWMVALAPMHLSPLETLLIDVADQVATITLNRPDRLNAYTVAMGAELFSSLRTLERSGEVRAVVITGAGRAFCAGMDLEGGDTFARERQFERTRALEKDVRPWNLTLPIIAAINGAAVGIGATLPLQWDIRIASEKARIGFVFTRRGIVPEANSTWILPRLIGLSAAMDLLITGRLVGAEEALRLGLVSRVVPEDRLLDEARMIALDIARNTAPVSVAITKRLLWRQLAFTDPREGKALEDALFEWSGKQPDAAEGVQAFLEKRAPEWSMRAPGDMPADLLPEIED